MRGWNTVHGVIPTAYNKLANNGFQFIPVGYVQLLQCCCMVTCTYVLKLRSYGGENSSTYNNIPYCTCFIHLCIWCSTSLAWESQWGLGRDDVDKIRCRSYRKQQIAKQRIPVHSVGHIQSLPPKLRPETPVVCPISRHFHEKWESYF